MANCPSALPTTATRIEDVPGGVSVTVTSPNPDIQHALHALAALHERIGSPQGPSYDHTGMHGGPGWIGHCPVIHNGTHVSYVRTKDGVRIEVRILPGHDVTALRREIYERAAELPKWTASR